MSDTDPRETGPRPCRTLADLAAVIDHARAAGVRLEDVGLMQYRDGGSYAAGIVVELLVWPPEGGDPESLELAVECDDDGND